MVREGFPAPHPKSQPNVFLEFFMDSHRGVEADTLITRIEFKRVAAKPSELGESSDQKEG